MTRPADTGDFLLVGCGAVGGVVAAHMLDQGHDVTLTTTNAAVAQQVDRDGLRVCTPDRRFQVNATVTTAPAPGRRFRYILLATQGDRAVEAARSALPALAEGGHVVVLQNGLCEERVADVVGAERVVGAVVGWGATRSPDGVWTKLGGGGFTVGRLDGGPANALADLIGPLSAVGPVKSTDNLRGARWSKLALNCAVSGLGTVLGDRMGVLLRHRFCRRLALEVMTEAVAVALAEGVQLEPIAGTLDPTWVALSDDERRARMHPGLIAKHLLLLGIGAKFRNMRSSMLRAIEAGRDPGVDLLNGEVVRRGERRGIPTPCNAAIERSVAAAARGELAHGLAAVRRVGADR